MDYNSDIYSIDIRNIRDNFINRIDSDILRQDLTDNINIYVDKSDITGGNDIEMCNMETGSLIEDDENIIKLRRTKCNKKTKKNISKSLVISDSNTNTNVSKLVKSKAYSSCLYWMLPDISVSNINFKNLIWKLLLYFLIVFFLRRIIFEIRCFN